MSEMKKEGKMSVSVKVTRAAWRVMMLDKELIGISAISMLINTVVFAAFVYVGIFLLPGTIIQSADQAGSFDWHYYLLLALYLSAACFVTNFFGGAISHAAFRRFDGEDPTMNEALSAASKKSAALIKYTGLQVTVGMILNIVADRVPFAGKLAVWLAGATWSVASMFSIPVIMSTNETNPVKVVKKSAKTFVDIWAESVFIGITLGVLSIIATIGTMIVVLGLFAAGVAFASGAMIVAAVVLLFGSFAGLALLSNTLHQIVMTAAYYYAATGNVPAGFDEELVRAMFRPKKKWLA
jgi:hypothetical protein